MKHIHTFESFLNEGNWSSMMKGVRSGESGPWSIIAIENKKVVGQKIDIQTKEIIPAHYEGMKKEYPKAKLHIEDGGGHVVWNESASIETFVDGETAVNEGSIDSLLDMLINSMEHYSEKDFVEAAKEAGFADASQMKKVYNGYWDIGAKDRNDWDIKEWINWLKKQGLKESLQEKKKKGLWANIEAKRNRGEKPAKPGDEDYPDEKAWKAAQGKK